VLCPAREQIILVRANLESVEREGGGRERQGGCAPRGFPFRIYPPKKGPAGMLAAGMRRRATPPAFAVPRVGELRRRGPGAR